MQNISKRLIVWVIVIVIILIIPLAVQFTNEVSWSEAAAYSVLLLAVGGFYELCRWLKTCNKTYRLAFGVGFGGILFLGWVSGAVGIIGSENNPANLMYWAVPTVLLFGSLISGFKPRGMARTLLTTALVQMLIPIVALFIWPAQTSWGQAGVIGVFIANSIFVALFAISALLFRRANASSFNQT